jgi:hypothetical protein
MSREGFVGGDAPAFIRDVSLSASGQERQQQRERRRGDGGALLAPGRDLPRHLCV